MSDFSIFIVGVVVTLITGMGVITSQVFLGYKPFKKSIDKNKEFITNIPINHTI